MTQSPAAPSETWTASVQAPDRPPVHVLVLGRDKHMFEACVDPRVRLCGLDEAPPERLDLVVVTCGTRWTLEFPRFDVPDGFWPAVARARAGLVFDASSEGREHNAQRTRAMHELLDAAGIARTRAVYLTQERNYPSDYLAHCEAEGLGAPMTVILHDLWIWRFLSRFGRGGTRILKARHAAFKSRPGRRTRAFVSLNFTPRPTKVLFLLSLLRDGLWDQGHISFGGFGEFNRRYRKDLAEFRRYMRRLEGFEDLTRALDPFLPTLDAFGQVMLGDVPREAEGGGVRKAPLGDMGIDEFNDSWFSVVTETEMRPRVSRITEKALKPLVNFHPFVMLGNPGALQMIRDLGFQTFDGEIDESYDLELDPRKRFEMAYAEVARLCRMEERERAAMEARLTPRLAANARRGLADLPREGRAANEAALLDRILAATRPAAATAD